MNVKATPKAAAVSAAAAKSGAEILIQSLIDEGTDTIFGYPGGVLLGIYDVLYRTPELKHILVRHEQGAAHAADGYARVTGKPGVVLVTSGPGATNTVTGIATAYMDSVPLVVLTGQVSSTAIGQDAFQEADIVGITRPITKHSYLIRDVEKIQETIAEAFHIAATGRPGPVLIDLPVDVMRATGSYKPESCVSLPGYQPRDTGNPPQIEKAARLLSTAERPVIYAGGGVITAEASTELTLLARTLNAPVATTLLGLGAFPETDPLSLGMLGMHGQWTANTAVAECDVLLAVGARFDDRVTGRLDRFATKARVIHIDMDPASISKVITAHVPIVGHARPILSALLETVTPLNTSAWLSQIAAWKKEHPAITQPTDKRLSAPDVLRQVADIMGHDTIVATDVGQNQMFAAQYWGFTRPRTLLSSGGLGTMGYGLPAAIGAAIGRPDCPVVCITGDGGFQMNIQELATAVHYGLPVLIVLLNNGYLGMVRQWQDLFFDKRYAHTDLDPGNPDFIRLAESFGAWAKRVTMADQVRPVIEAALEVVDCPRVIEFVVSREENVMPMVPAGAATTDMLESELIKGVRS
ncbi:biosynthetic-type acetolactate synthase large subunit [bacterium]|nr:biosynthetic-type acetolactate synthase large subunit [bacterium]